MKKTPSLPAAPLKAGPRFPLIIGHLGRPRGLRGEVRVLSYTTPPDKVFTYQPCWHRGLAPGAWEPLIWEAYTDRDPVLYGCIAGVEDRDAASRLTHHRLFICRSQLPTLPPGEYYWAQLEGLTVIDGTRGRLGQVDHLMATGANDVFVVREGNNTRLIPYLDQVVLHVDLDNRILQVDWPEDV